MTLLAPAFLDANVYDFAWLRNLPEFAGLQEGVVGSGDLKVTPNATGLRVDIAAGRALIKGDSGVPQLGLSQGLYPIINDAAVAAAVTLPAAHATLPRLDQIVAHLYDATDLGDGSNQVLFEYVAGVATSGATLDNRNGAATLGNNRLLIADVLIPAAATGPISAANIRDRRARAGGAYYRNVRTGGNYTWSSLTLTALDSTNLKARIECTGKPIQIGLRGKLYCSTTAVGLVPLIDGAAPTLDGAAPNSNWDQGLLFAGSHFGLNACWDYEPTAGSHTFEWAWAVSNAGVTATLYATAVYPLQMFVTEIARPNASNN